MTPRLALLLLFSLSVISDAHGVNAFGQATAEMPTTVSIAVGEEPSSSETIAARELSHYLQQLYAGTQFEVVRQVPSTGKVIYIGTPESAPQLLKYLGNRRLQGPESYVVTSAAVNGRPCGLIVGAGPAGVMYGVYGLLGKLGCGFYLSFETMPAPRSQPFTFDQWNLADRPLVPVRLVFNWHNFLSGCSTWNLEHWRKWIAQSQKMGYNAVMVLTGRYL